MKLHYGHYGSGIETLIILHGLFGSERNWMRAVKSLGGHFAIIVPDMRNHGQSPHHPVHTIAAMRTDIEELAFDLNLEKFFLLGHSMGGYVAMDFALRHPERISGLIVEDIAPRSYPSRGILSLINALSSMNLSRITDKKQADFELTAAVPDAAVRQFLLTNLASRGGRLYWRIHLPALRDFVENEFESYQKNENARFRGPSLFIGGADSPYRIRQDADLIHRYFPAAEIETIPGAGHWPHYEQPELFVESILRFTGKLTNDF